MIVLGLKCFSHDTGAAILSDESGRLEITAISEARLNRRKHSFTYPLMSIAYCLDALGLHGLDEVDLVCIDRHMEEWPEPRSQFGFENARVRHQPRYDDNHRWNYLVEQSMDWSGTTVRWVNHVDAHAASAYFVSPFDDAAVLVAEGGTGIYRGTGTDLAVIDRIGYLGDTYQGGRKLAQRRDHFVNSSFLYDRVGAVLGYDVFGAGQTMALAGYAGAFPERDLFHVDPERFDGFIVNHDKTVHAMRDMPAHEGSDTALVSEHWVNLARQAQAVLQADIMHLARLAREETGARHLTLAGGAALNCIINREILDSGLFDGLYIQPAASDEGIPLGAALFGYYAAGGRCRTEMRHAYLGRANHPADLERALAARGLPGQPATPREVAALLADGKVVGRLAGGAEYGPRALGNRSILADPRDPAMRDRLNAEIKRREGFRPFAPSVLEDNLPGYFNAPASSPFMILAGQVSDDGRRRVPAVVHADGSSRVQTVSRADNPDYHALITAFGELTGVPVLLNTSFNGQGEPIVETYDDALSCFLRTGLDAVVLDGTLVMRGPETPPVDGQSELARVAAETERRYTALIGRFCDVATYVALGEKLAEAQENARAGA